MYDVSSFTAALLGGDDIYFCTKYCKPTVVQKRLPKNKLTTVNRSYTEARSTCNTQAAPDVQALPVFCQIGQDQLQCSSNPGPPGIRRDRGHTSLELGANQGLVILHLYLHTTTLHTVIYRGETAAVAVTMTSVALGGMFLHHKEHGH